MAKGPLSSSPLVWETQNLQHRMLFLQPVCLFYNSQHVVAGETRVELRVTRYKPCRRPTPRTACQVTDMGVLPVALILNSQPFSAGSPRLPLPCRT